MNSQIKNKAVYWGTGRRKTSVARVRLIPGNGLIKINGRSGDDYLNFNPLHLNSIKAPLQTLGLENSYDIFVNAVYEENVFKKINNNDFFPVFLIKGFS